MFYINDDNSIYVTRGDILFFSVSAEENGTPYIFQAGDVVRIKVFGKKDCENVVLQKDFPVFESTEEVAIFLNEEDTRIGKTISKPRDYWYEVELNPDANPQTIIGYDEEGPVIFKLFPEGEEIEVSDVITPEDVPFIDEELNLSSNNPVANRVVAREIINLREQVERLKNPSNAQVEEVSE